MSNINKHSYFALGLKNGDYAYSLPVEGYSLCGGDPFSFSISFYMRRYDLNMSFFKQEGTFDIGYEDGHIYYRAAGLGEIAAGTDTLVIAEDTWNVLDITYDGGKISFYMNGVLGYEKDIISPSYTNENYYKIGENFVGYIRRVKGYNFCLTKADIVNNQYDCKISTEKMEFCFDFTEYRGSDKGKNNLTILVSGLSSIKNLIKTLTLEGNGFALPSNSHKVNPGGFASNQFTILTKVFLTKGMDEETVIVTNGEMGTESALTLGVKYLKQYDKYFLFVKWGTESLISSTNICDYSWIDAAVTYKDNRLKLYIDGTKDVEKSITNVPQPMQWGNIVIGNTLINGRPRAETTLNGYVDYVSIFEQELTGEKLTAYVENPPFIYENYLAALYGFWEEEACDYLTGSFIAFSDDAKMDFIENTVFSENIGNINYDYGISSKQYTEFQKWQVMTIVSAVTSYIKAEAGLEPTAGILENGEPAGKIMDLMVKEVLPQPEVQDLLASYNTLTETQVRNMMKVLYDKGSLNQLLFSFYGKTSGFQVLVVPAITGVFVKEEVAFYIAGGVLIALVTVVVVKTKTKEPPAPTPPYDPEIKYRFVSIKSITFNHAPDDHSISGVNIRKNAQETIPIPEWVDVVNSSMKDPSLAAYIKSAVTNISIFVKLYYETNYTDVVNGIISANCSSDGILGNIVGINVNFQETGEYDVEIPLSNQSINGRSLGRYLDQLNWKCSLTGFIGASYHKIYSIDQVPIEPWSIESAYPEKFPTIGALEIFSDTMLFTENFYEGVGETLETIATRTMQMLFHSGKFSYPEDCEPKYSEINDESDLPVFDSERFEAAYQAEPGLLVNCLDCSLIIANNCHLNGHQMKIMSIHSLMPFIKAGEEGFPPPMYFREIKVIGKDAFEPLEDIDLHYLAVTGDGTLTTTHIFDGSLIARYIDGRDLEAANLIFSDTNTETVGARNDNFYREAFFIEGSSCMRDILYEHWVRGPAAREETKKKITLLATGFFPYDNRTLGINIAGRENFEKAITDAIICPPGQARCHSVSYSTLCEGICSPINACLAGTKTDIELQRYLEGMKDATYINGNPGGVFARYYNGAITFIGEILNEIRGGRDINKICSSANELLKNLNNSRDNLRLGDSNWNSSIQAAFDPVYWIYVNKVGMVESDHAGLNYTPPYNFPVGLPAARTDGFYLTDLTDGRRMDIIKSRTKGDGSFCVYKAKVRGSVQRFLFSSSNQYPLMQYCETGKKAYYLYNNTWNLI
ncbi:LamG-like jellyroll fold domain-containing protein [Anaerosacchariphilus polymeriproducens]|uniref:LamG-like jellyroll fold domain-containing protein n=1 Tax=Anaerosacchariphilus polymeriproducens TaxID=1812858 RepID=A0A371ARG8_9FIRM|nr:LamG-like jellyroll fold domain-containing protein [Anaerosacchariphilus polymeriproducens]RDU22167.1 hypothetical protein DWV06_16690 [Anaerosacchariphilus polymeriproducens]